MSNNKYSYASTTDKSYWTDFLMRSLDDEEKSLFDSVKKERYLNKKIEKLNDAAFTLDLYIPVLTNMDGNCLFECLTYFDLCDSIEEIRMAVATALYIFKDHHNFIPNTDLTLRELFNLRNEFEYVFCYKQKLLYKYTYDIMCIDVANSNSWQRLPTEMILSVLSFIYNLKFNILHDNGHLTVIDIISNGDTKNIYLGLLSEFHYIPLDLRKGKEYENKIQKYMDATIEFHKWARSMCNSIDKSDNNEKETKNVKIEQPHIQFKQIEKQDINDNELVTFE